jgi:hypothetical protein
MRVSGAWARFWLIVISLVSTMVLADDVYSLFRQGPAQTEFTGALQSDFQRDILPNVQTIAVQAHSESKPQIEKAFTDLNGRVPELANASLQQLDQLQKDLPERGNKVLSASFGDMLQREDSKIRSMFPEATDQNVTAMITNISTQAQSDFGDATNSLFAQHVQAMNGIVADLTKIQNTEKVNPSADKADWEMALMVVDAFHDDLQGMAGQPQTGAAKAIKEAKK